MSVCAKSARGLPRSAEGLHIQEVGCGSPLLLLHPALGSFDTLKDERHGGVSAWIAARGCRVIGVDLPGHGQSPPSSFPPSFLDICVDQTLAVLEPLALTRIPVVGIGFGGLVALKLAATLPRRVSCVITDSAPGSCARTFPEPWPGLTPQGPDGGELLEKWRRYTATVEWQTLFPALVTQLPMPCLVMTGSDDSRTDLASLYALARTRPNLRIAAIPGDAPPACLRTPRFFLREVEQFLAAHS